MKLDNTFWGGMGGGGQKFVLIRVQAVGRTATVRTSSGQMVMQVKMYRLGISYWLRIKNSQPVHFHRKMAEIHRKWPKCTGWE